MDKSIIISVYRNAKDNKGSKIGLLRWLEGFERYNPLVDKIRLEPDKNKRDELKKWLPCITASGLFEKRNEPGLIKHSGFIALDFDKCEPQEAKQLLAKIKNVFYAGLSASGRGVWALIPLKHPQHHKLHFKALEADFKAMGLIIDPACKDVCRLRFYSYDPDPIFNLEAVPYEKLKALNPAPPLKQYKYTDKTEVQKFEIALKYCERQGLYLVDGQKHTFLTTFARVCKLQGLAMGEVENFINNNLINLSDIKSNCISYVFKE